MWDGKHKKINELTVFYACLEALVKQCVPIVLTPPSGGSVIALCKICMFNLERVQIEFKDLFRSL